MFDDTSKEVSASDELIAASYRDASIRSVIAVPLFKNGRFAAALFVNSRTPRIWASHAPAIVMDVAERTWSALEQTRAENARRAAEALNALILGSSRDCIVVLDLDGHTQFVSPGGIEAMEISDVQPIIGLNWLRVWAGDDHEAARNAISDARS